MLPTVSANDKLLAVNLLPTTCLQAVQGQFLAPMAKKKFRHRRTAQRHCTRFDFKEAGREVGAMLLFLLSPFEGPRGWEICFFLNIFVAGRAHHFRVAGGGFFIGGSHTHWDGPFAGQHRDLQGHGHRGLEMRLATSNPSSHAG